MHFTFCISTLFAQSTNQSFPTPVTTSEISGKINARDLGDARLTSYFYTFTGNQGDVFINVVTKNLDGDIDVFTANNLRPLTKITVYSDNPENETGRIVYLRQSEKLILRIEGRTPNDEPATFRIKFAGSFEPLKAIAETEEQNPPEVKAENQGEVRVNSVGTIIEVKPKPTPKVKEAEKSEIIAESKKEVKKKEKPVEKEKAEEKKAETDEAAEKKEAEQSEKEVDKPKEKTAPVVVITDNLPKTDEKKTEKTGEKKADETVVKNESKTKKNSTKKVKPVEPNPLENILLVVLFKDGTKIERPMSEVLRVNVDKGILTIVAKDGTIGRYSILDVAEMTIK
ncbi:MAG: hypothetical protein WA584_15755 [Pyrinomonadaceae bacterium]